MTAAIKMDHLGKYRLDGVIGEGAMGVVYKGFDSDIERPVAVKVLHSHLLGDDMGDELAIRFRLEAKAAARCMHSHIVTVFDYGVSNESHYIVMEYIEGIDLKALLRQEKRIPFRQASDTIFQVLSALEHAHKNGVIHRDIKPANIMVLDNGHVKVADFGVARLVSSDITQAGFMIGTPGYMSPEGRTGGTVDHRSDLYSVGVVFYEILTGKRLKLERPDNTTLKTELIEAIGEPEMAGKIHQLLVTALQENLVLRFNNAAEFSRRLGSVLSPDRRHFPDTEELAATVLRTARQPIEDLRAQIRGSRLDSETASEITPSVIKQLEQALLVYVGPIASQLVKKYARQYCDIDSLLDALSSHIPNQREQTQFRSAVNASGLTLITGANLQTHSSGTTDREAVSPAVTLTEEQHQQIGRLLAQFIGPLASRIVARNQQAAVSPTDFRNRLAESISNQTERVEFLKKLEKLLQDSSRIV